MYVTGSGGTGDILLNGNCVILCLFSRRFILFEFRASPVAYFIVYYFVIVTLMQIIFRFQPLVIMFTSSCTWIDLVVSKMAYAFVFTRWIINTRNEWQELNSHHAAEKDTCYYQEGGKKKTSPNISLCIQHIQNKTIWYQSQICNLSDHILIIIWNKGTIFTWQNNDELYNKETRSVS